MSGQGADPGGVYHVRIGQMEDLYPRKGADHQSDAYNTKKQVDRKPVRECELGDGQSEIPHSAIMAG